MKLSRGIDVCARVYSFAVAQLAHINSSLLRDASKFSTPLKTQFPQNRAVYFLILSGDER